MCADGGHAWEPGGMPLKGSIIYQKYIETMSREIKDKNTSKRATEKREEERRT